MKEEKIQTNDGGILEKLQTLQRETWKNEDIEDKSRLKKR